MIFHCIHSKSGSLVTLVLLRIMNILKLSKRSSTSQLGYWAFTIMSSSVSLELAQVTFLIYTVPCNPPLCNSSTSSGTSIPSPLPTPWKRTSNTEQRRKCGEVAGYVASIGISATLQLTSTLSLQHHSSITENGEQ